MAALEELVEWVEELYRIELDDPVEGGEDGIDNVNAKKLGARTRFLKAAIETTAAALAGLDRIISATVITGASATGARQEQDVSSTSHRRRVFGTANTLGLTETANASGATIAAAGPLAIGGAGATKIQPSTNAVASLESANGGSYWAAENTYAAGFTVGNLVFTAAGSVSFDNGGVYNVRGPGPLTVTTSGNERRWRLEWPSAVAIVTATTSILATLTPDTTMPAVFDGYVLVRRTTSPTAATTAIWRVRRAAITVGGVVTPIGDDIIELVSESTDGCSLAWGISTTTTTLVLTTPNTTPRTAEATIMEMR